MSAILSPFKKIYDLIDGFVLIMLTAIGVALLAPQIGAGDGPLHLGMVVTPLLMGLVISASGASMPLGKALTGVALQLLLPFALGQLARPLIGSWLAKKKQITNKIDRGVIVLIVYSSFCDATAAGLW